MWVKTNGKEGEKKGIKREKKRERPRGIEIKIGRWIRGSRQV